MKTRNDHGACVPSDGGVIRLVYRARGPADVIHRFSVENYELPSSELVSWMEALEPRIPEDTPILLEIACPGLSAEEQSAAERAVRTRYRLELAQAVQELRASRRKLLVFAICLLVSSVLLGVGSRVTDEVLAQLLYLPFWFFGYRVLTFPIFDHLPLLAQVKRRAQLASLSVRTVREPGGPLTDAEREGISASYSALRAQALRRTDCRRLVEDYLMERGTAEMICRAGSAAELMNPHCTGGNELLSDDALFYLDGAEPFIQPGMPVRLELRLPAPSPEDREALIRAVRNSYRLRAERVRLDGIANRRMILGFGACLAASALLLGLWGSRGGVAVHELLLVLFWFFGDYLVEFLLLSRRSLRRERDKWNTLAGTVPSFVSDNNKAADDPPSL